MNDIPLNEICLYGKYARAMHACIAGYQGMTYAQAQDYVVTTGALTLFEYVKKAIWRRVVQWLKKKIEQ